VDNSPPPEPHDVRAHLLGGVPVAEVQAKRPLFDALGFDLTHAFTARTNDTAYFDFATALADRSAIRTLVENDAGVQARIRTLRDALAVWWDVHAARLADLPTRRDLNAVRTEFLDSFVAALSPLGMLDRFKLAGVIATWWTDTLPDFKTLLENGFPGVIDGWVDAIADAVEDDEAAGPAFDPFAHKLVRHTMADYLNKIAAAKADIARLKGEKEAFEQSNAPDEADEEELANWNYARELERQARELKAEHRDAIRELTRLDRAAARAHATDADRRAAAEAKAALQPMFDRLASIETELAPYECIKAQLGEARTRYRKLTNAFVDELKARCTIMSEDEKRALVLELLAQDVQAGLDSAVSEKSQECIDFLANLWGKYCIPLTQVAQCRGSAQAVLDRMLREIGYA
jgi:type I restriction enzyme M protein